MLWSDSERDTGERGRDGGAMVARTLPTSEAPTSSALAAVAARSRSTRTRQHASAAITAHANAEHDAATGMTHVGREVEVGVAATAAASAAEPMLEAVC